MKNASQIILTSSRIDFFFSKGKHTGYPIEEKNQTEKVEFHSSKFHSSSIKYSDNVCDISILSNILTR